MLRIASCTHILAAPGSRHLAQRCGGTRYSRQPSTGATDRKSTRLNSSHTVISYAVFCLKKKKALRHPRHQVLARRRELGLGLLRLVLGLCKADVVILPVQRLRVVPHVEAVVDVSHVLCT